MTEEPTKMTRHECTKTLSCKLTTKELLIMASDCAREEQHIRLLEGEKKEKVDEYNGKIKTAQGQMQRLCACVRSKSEERLVKCEQVFDYASGVVFIKRLDTGEDFEQRPMKNEERQDTMDPVLPEEPPAEEEGKGNETSEPEAVEAEGGQEAEPEEAPSEAAVDGSTSLEDDLEREAIVDADVQPEALPVP